MKITAFDLAQRFTGITEIDGRVANPQIMAMLQLDFKWPDDDSVPWCSGFVNYIAWLLRLPRSKSLLARSWLSVGRTIPLEEAEVGFDVVIFKRGEGEQPGKWNLTAPGHVGFFAGRDPVYVQVLGGNQKNMVGIDHYSIDRLLDVRRLLTEE